MLKLQSPLLWIWLVSCQSHVASDASLMLAGCSDANLMLELDNSGFLGCVWKRSSFLKLHVTPETVFLFSAIFLGTSPFSAFTSSRQAAWHGAHCRNAKKTIRLPRQMVVVVTLCGFLPQGASCLFASLSGLCLCCRASATEELSCSWVNFPSRGQGAEV